MKKLEQILIFTFIIFSFFATAQSNSSPSIVLAMASNSNINKVKYSFDVSLLEKQGEIKSEKEIIGATVSILNNTTGETELSNYTLSDATFNFDFIEGNHYTLTIQKDGFKTKKLEAFVKIEGCILCFEGLNMVESRELAINENVEVIKANVELKRK